MKKLSSQFDQLLASLEANGSEPGDRKNRRGPRGLGFARELFQHYHDYHSYGPPRLKYLGIIGVMGFSSFYLLRFTRPNPQPFDDIVLRLASIIAMLLLALKDRWPLHLQRYYIGFSYIALTFALPFFAAYSGLMRGGGVPSISNGFIAVCFLTLLADWRNIFAMLMIGITAAWAVFRVLFPEKPIPHDLIAQIPAYALLAVAGYSFKYSTEQADTQRKAAARQEDDERRITALRDSMAFMAHELNTPLATVRLSVNAMRSSLEVAATANPPCPSGLVALHERRPGDTARILERAERAALYSQSLVLSVVQSAREAFPGVGTESVSAKDLIAALLRDYPFERHEADALSTEVRQNFVISNGRRDLLFLVLCTIAKNALYALRGTPSPSLVIRVATTLGQDGRPLRGFISFCDNGVGIAADVLAKLTHTPVTTRQDEGGSGMGLLFCRRVMESLGGTLQVSSVQSQGTEITLDFDLQRGAEGPREDA